MNYPKSVQDLINCFSKYPGIGNKSAERIAIHTVIKLEEKDIDDLINSLKSIKENLKNCSVCGIITENDICDICSDTTRSSDLLIVVEDIKDVFAIEKIKSFNGKYHILKGLLNPIDGVGVQDIRLKELVERLKENIPNEIIIALSSTLEGEQTSMYISRLLEKTGIKITKLAHGLPVGANLEYADEITILKALEGRTKI